MKNVVSNYDNAKPFQSPAGAMRIILFLLRTGHNAANSIAECNRNYIISLRENSK